MTGQKIKEILRSEGITIADVARVTNKSVCCFYEGSGNTVATDHGIAVSGDSNQINALSEKFIALLEKKDEQMDRLIGIIEKGYKKEEI